MQDFFDCLSDRLNSAFAPAVIRVGNPRELDLTGSTFASKYKTWTIILIDRCMENGLGVSFACKNVVYVVLIRTVLVDQVEEWLVQQYPHHLAELSVFTRWSKTILTGLRRAASTLRMFLLLRHASKQSKTKDENKS